MASFLIPFISNVQQHKLRSTRIVFHTLFGKIVDIIKHLLVQKNVLYSHFESFIWYNVAWDSVLLFSLISPCLLKLTAIRMSLTNQNNGLPMLHSMHTDHWFFFFFFLSTSRGNFQQPTLPLLHHFYFSSLNIGGFLCIFACFLCTTLLQYLVFCKHLYMFNWLGYLVSCD